MAVTGTAWVAANAAYLAAVADQTRAPGPLLSALARWFPFGPEAGVLSVEDYCPLGPIEGAVRFFQTWGAGEGLSFVGPVTLRNLAVLLACLGLAVVTKKTFCSWLCPFGALVEGLRALGARLGVPAWKPRARVDRALGWGRYLVLALVVALTAWSGTLVFKDVDPFYALYSLGSERVAWPAYAVLGAVLLGALANAGVWCRYLCPLSAVFDPPSRLGLIRLARTERCVRCGDCAAACPQRLPVPVRSRVTDARCTNCLDCLDRCPEPGALELRLEVRP